MCGDICVFVETLRGQVTDITYVMLAAGRVLAKGLNAKLTAVLFGSGIGKLVDKLGAADRVMTLDHPALVEFNPDAYLAGIAGVLAEHKPRVMLFGHTAMGTDLACGVAQRLSLPLATSCRTFTVDGADAKFAALTCGGKLIAEGTLPGPSCIATVMPGGYKADDGKVAKAPPAEALAAPAGLDVARTKFAEYIEPPAGDVDIAKENVVVSVGRGIQNQDNIALADRLAKALGGVVAGSRPVIDQAWLPTSRLVGKSGKQVKPKLYLAVGISGAPEHLEGVPEADTMIAINTDANAPIFDVAHFGTTCDALKLMPMLAEKIK